MSTENIFKHIYILKSALSYDPTDMDPCKFEWSKDGLTKSLVHISVPSDVLAAPNDIHNPNTFSGWWGRCEKTSRRRKEGWREIACVAGLRGRGSNPEPTTC